MDEINNLVKKAFDSNLSSYFRQDAIRQLGRIQKSVQLTKAVIKLLQDVKEEPLQREVMDLSAKLAISEAVNFIIPISGGASQNARHAINVLAKIGGRQAYDCLKITADTPGFNLSKTGAKRGLQDMLRRQPELESLEPEIKAVKYVPQEESILTAISAEVKEFTEDAVKVITSLPEKVSQAVTDTGIIEAKEEQKQLVEDKEQLASLSIDLDKYKLIIAERDVLIARLNDDISTLKKVKPVESPNREALKMVQQLKSEKARIQAGYEKKIVLHENRIHSLEDELESARRRARKKNPQKSSAGCIAIIITMFALFMIIKGLGIIF